MMRMSRLALSAVAVIGTAAAVAATEPRSRVGVGVTGTLSVNPYIDSDALTYGIGCMTYGCLGRYNFKTGDFDHMLAKGWEVQDENTWIFHLRDDVYWHNGDPVTAADVVHSHERRMAEPLGRQKTNGRPIASMEAVDDHTLKITTIQPTATLPLLLYSRLIITNKALYEEHGGEVADREYPIGFGPYRISFVSDGQRFAVERVDDNPFGNPDSPDEIVYFVMRESEQRVTALLRGEIDVAMYVPPHMYDRIQNAPNTRMETANGVEVNFLAMNPAHYPWDNKLLRQAVAHAIDREMIVEVIQRGLADVLYGPIGPGQYAYDPDLEPRYEYDPERARELLAEAGYPNGLSVTLATPVGRYTNDRQAVEAMAAMLGEIGIQVELETPEWSRMTQDVNQSLVPFFFYGRGSVDDPSAMLSQWFETGVADRIRFSDPEVDELLQRERRTFDPEARVATLREAMSLIMEHVPLHFLWRMQQLYGVSERINYTPDGSANVFGPDISMR